VVLGPGAGRAPSTQRLLLELAGRLDVPLVVDADALYALAERPQGWRERAAPTVLTPHEAEAARVLGLTAGEVKGARLGAARLLAHLTGATVVLKGPGTLVVPSPGTPGRPWRCAQGGPLLATGGTGDVLAGVLGALLAQDPSDPTRAAQRAVRWHATAGDLLARRHGVDRGLTAREVADALPAALRRWRGAR
jgi:NAD(P)H-hydrate epimerase